MLPLSKKAQPPPPLPNNNNTNISKLKNNHHTGNDNNTIMVEECECECDDSSHEDDGSDHDIEEDMHVQQQQQQQKYPLTTVDDDATSRDNTNTFMDMMMIPTATTFRDDVRNEWIHAVFGADFVPDGRASSSSGSSTRTSGHTNKRPRQGMGLAQIAPYTSYQVHIPAAMTTSTSHDKKGSSSNSKQQQQQQQQQQHVQLPLLGISIARLAVGLYVRHVSPGSEAWCAGIIPHSVLVSINGMNLLAEPSKQALERLWQYEGFTTSTTSSSSSGGGVASESGSSQNNNAGGKTPNTPSRNTTSAAAPGAAADESSSSLLSTCIRQPVHMTLIYQGQLYSVVLLSNPPYGIDWAPCGNFALVKRAYSHAHDAGVVKGSIIANITTTTTTTSSSSSNSNNNNNAANDHGDESSMPFVPKDIYELDHTMAAESLRTLVTIRRDIQLTLCIPPSEARSGHWERLWEAHQERGGNPQAPTPTVSAATSNNNNNNNNKATNTSNTTNSVVQLNKPSYYTRPKVHRPQVAAQLDGVEIRVHPLWFSNPGSPPSSSFSSNPPRTGGTAAAATTTTTTSLSQLAFRVAAGEFFSFHSRPPHLRRNHRRQNHHYRHYSQRHYYRSCPPLDRPLMELFSVDDALVYLLQYDKANYDERNTILTATATNSATAASQSRVLSFLKQQSPRESRKSMESFLLPLLALLRRQQQQLEDPPSTSSSSPLANLLLEMVASHNNNTTNTNNNNNINNLDLCHRMECMAQALELKDMKEELERRRNQRLLQNTSATSTTPSSSSQQERRRQPRQIPIRIEQAPDHNPVPASTCTSTATTGTTMTTTTTTTTGTTTTAPSTTTNGGDVGIEASKSRKGMFGFFRKNKKPSWGSRRRNNKKVVSTEQEEKQQQQSPSHLNTTVVVTRNSTRNNNKNAPLSQSTTQSMPPRRAIIDGTTTPSASTVTYRHLAPQRISKDVLFSNTLAFLKELEGVCLEIEKSLLRSFSQKIAGWALQPWSASKETELAQVTQVMRERLRKLSPTAFPLLNPIIDSETLVSVDAQGSYILPSAHFPLLLTFDCQEEFPGAGASSSSFFTRTNFSGRETMYRTKVELVELTQGSNRKPTESSSSSSANRTFTVHGSVGGTVNQSAPSIATNHSSDRHSWDQGNVLTFDCRSSWGAPETLTLLVSQQSTEGIVNSDENGKLHYEKEIGYCFVDMATLWQQAVENDDNTISTAAKANQSYHLKVWSQQGIHHFDEHGDSPGDSPETVVEDIEIQINVTLQRIPLTGSSGLWVKKRSLLYKHDDDVRQELFAIEFIKSCDTILKSCGLDLKLLTFRCIPVAKRRGFIEWVHGSVPLSEICQPFAGSILDGNKKDAPRATSNKSEEDPLSSVAKAGLTKYESLRRVNSSQPQKKNSPVVNPIQEYLRAFHFNPKDPYMIRKQVMETYVKSCAGYSVITYILGVGDRHLDNLLLHPTGHFFHCDFSFILGHDPKKYLPLRITEDMVEGMGGRESDNYAMFLSLTCAAFLTFRRPENVRHLMSFVRLMEDCCTLPSNIDSKQALETAMLGVRERLQLDLTADEAISFMEKLIEESCSSRMWLAVDAIHSLGKRF